jgi:hypothetical protein
MRSGPWLAALLTVVLPGACQPSQSALTGIGEPIQIANGQFISGTLPGTPAPPSDGGATAPEEGGVAEAGPPAPLTITDLGGFVSTSIQAGQAGLSFSGDASNDAVAVGVQLAGLGTGYWVVPLGAPDSLNPAFFTFGISANFNLSDPPGLRDLLFVAIDGQGHAGAQSAIQLCLNSRIPDNGFACYPDIQAPPKAVFTLEWDTSFELDLHVVTPSGADINPNAPYGGPVEAGVHGINPDLPHLDRDSDDNCVPDGLNQEDAIFPDALPVGTYTIYVDPFAACGQAAAHFKFTISQSSGTCPGPTCRFGPVSSVSGEVTASDVTGGAGSMLKIDQLTVN